MKWIVDRIEKNIAVIETPQGMLSVPLKMLPEGTAEGDVLRLEIDKPAREEIEKRVQRKMKGLFGE